MEKRTEEWLRLSDYAAEFLLKGGRTIYAVFMCHLAVEKALKGLYFEKIKTIPPKSHNLINLLNGIGINPPENLSKFILKLNETNIITRYPDELSLVQKNYNQTVVNKVLTEGKELIMWIKSQLLIL